MIASLCTSLARIFRNKADELKKARLESHPEVFLYHAAVRTETRSRERPVGATMGASVCWRDGEEKQNGLCTRREELET